MLFRTQMFALLVFLSTSACSPALAKDGVTQSFSTSCEQTYGAGGSACTLTVDSDGLAYRNSKMKVDRRIPWDDCDSWQWNERYESFDFNSLSFRIPSIAAGRELAQVCRALASNKDKDSLNYIKPNTDADPKTAPDSYEVDADIGYNRVPCIARASSDGFSYRFGRADVKHQIPWANVVTWDWARNSGHIGFYCTRDRKPDLRSQSSKDWEYLSFRVESVAKQAKLVSVFRKYAASQELEAQPAGIAYETPRKGIVKDANAVYTKLPSNSHAQNAIKQLWPQSHATIIKRSDEKWLKSVGWVAKEGLSGAILGEIRHPSTGEILLLMEFEHKGQRVYCFISNQAVSTVN